MESSEFTCLDNSFATTRMVTTRPLKSGNDSDAEAKSCPSINAQQRSVEEGGLRTRGYFKVSTDDRPLVSVITVVLNGHKYIEQTIQSVLSQTYDNVEYIVVDGDSVDGTVNTIKKYDRVIDYWLSGPDEGIYDAMNKGIRLTNGEWIWILNADDYLEVSAIEQLIASIKEHSAGCDAIYGCIRKRFGSFDLIIGRRNLSDCDCAVKFNHPATLVCSSVFQSFGCFDMNFRYSSDYEFFMRLVRAGVKFHFVDAVCANMRWCGISDRLNRYLDRGREHFLIDVEYLGLARAAGNAARFFTIGLAKLIVRKVLFAAGWNWPIRMYYARKQDYRLYPQTRASGE